MAIVAAWTACTAICEKGRSFRTTTYKVGGVSDLVDDVDVEDVCWWL